MMKTTLVLSGLALVSAKVDWMGICTTSGDVAAICADLDRGSTYACLAEEYQKDDALSALTFPCKDAMYERSQEARDQAKEAAAAEQAARAAISASGVAAGKIDWFGTCTKAGDVDRVCPGMTRSEAFACLAKEYQKGEEGDLGDKCAGSILARSEASRAETIKNLWKTTCIDDIANLCPSGTTSSVEKITCMGENLAQVSEQCVEALKLLQQSLQAEAAMKEALATQAAAEAAGTNVDVLVPPPVASRPTMPDRRPSTPMEPPSGFAGVDAEVAPVVTKPKGKGQKGKGGKGGKGKGGKGKKGKGRGKGGKAKKPVCPMVSAFTAGGCPKKIRLGFGIEDGKCKPVMGCANQRMAARKAKFFKTQVACNRAVKKC